MQKRMTMAVGLAASLMLFFGCENLKPIGSRGSKSTAGKGGVKLEMYVMSKCPYGVQAVQGIKRALQDWTTDNQITDHRQGRSGP